MKPDFKEIVQHFEFEGDFSSAISYGTGHINDTYIASFEDNGSTRRYILQRINHHIFLNPEGMMKNIEAVTAHLGRRIETAGGDPQREALTLIPTVEENSYFLTEQGDYWRGYLFINNARTYEVVENLDHVYNAAKAFGNFQNLLSDYPSEKLIETIPYFHNTRKRYQDFIEAVEREEVNRAKSSEPEIEFVLHREKDTSVLIDLLAQGELPERITHNDTKFNNVMIDNETGAGVCVIDLDTVMPGLSLYDFGDAIRSLANSAAEDEQDLSQVQFDSEIYEHYTHGYLDAVGNLLTETEIEYMPFSAILMTLECGMRFLADHLQGDTYFKIHRENHNLDRCRTQFKLVADMEEQFDEMVRIVNKYR
ncbi:MAG: aminoglycoside phosphotransferase family protein [Anaerolineales bacterium]